MYTYQSLFMEWFDSLAFARSLTTPFNSAVSRTGRPQRKRATLARLARLEVHDPLPAGAAKIGGPNNSILIYADSPSLYDLNDGDRVTGTATVCNTDDTVTIKRRYFTYLYAEGNKGNEDEFARVDWGFNIVFTVKATAATTTGTVTLATPDIIQDPSTEKLDNATTNGKLVDDPRNAAQFDIVEGP